LADGCRQRSVNFGLLGYLAASGASGDFNKDGVQNFMINLTHVLGSIRFSHCACLMLLALALMACGVESDESRSGNGLQTEESRPVRRLLFIGLDGAEWDVINPMIMRGELPNLEMLITKGAHASLIIPMQSVSPVVWTTFLTGHFSRHHGILDFLYPYETGADKRPVESTQRQKPAIWNLLSDQGKRVKAIGFFASHPSDEVNGVMVSDRAFSDPEGGFWPRTLAEQFSSDDFFPSSAHNIALQRFFGWPNYFKPKSEQTDVERTAADLVTGRVSGTVIGDTYLQSVASNLSDDYWDFYGAYYRITDVASHSLWKYHDDTDFEDKAEPEVKELVGDVISEAYRFADQAIGDLLSEAGPDVNVVVVSDHGFGSATGQYRVRDSELLMLTGNHRPDGIFIAAGPDVVKGKFPGITVFDVMPTMMALMGQPVASDLPGEVDLRLIAPEFLEAHPIQQIANYGTEWRSNVSSLDQEAQRSTLQNLKALGYIDSDVGGVYAEGVADYDFWTADPSLIRANLHGEIVYYLLREDEEKALAVLEEAASEAPEIFESLLGQVRGKVNGIRAEHVMEGLAAPGFEEFMETHAPKLRPIALSSRSQPPVERSVQSSVIDFQKKIGLTNQVGAGFYAPEGEGWRWMSRRAAVTLAVPPAPSRWLVEGWVDLDNYDGQPLGIDVIIDGQFRQSFTISESGSFGLEGKLESVSESQVLIEIQCDRSFTPAGSTDIRELCAVIRRVEVM
jgi:hypothetical protein